MKKKQKIFVHLLFWFYMLNQFLYPLYINKADAEYLKSIGIELTLSIINFYAIYLSLPFLMKQKHKILSIFMGMVMIFIIAVFRYYTEVVFWKYIMQMPPKDMAYLREWFYNGIRLSVITAIYALLIKFVIDWFEGQKLKAELINQNQASELALLRSQVNPHFLFNTLNNVYSLVYSRSEDAPAALMKLSSIMRYMLYDTSTDKVLLEKEVEYLQSFIELSKLRVRQKNFVEMTVSGVINGRTIAPMLLIPFVENAFKHGSKTIPSPGILIHLSIEPNQILFEVTNHMRKNTVVEKDKIGGIGMNNIHRRLDLLYPGKYSLDISTDNDLYKVKLILKNR
jgi:two-component system, LytTR family, sensor kinase